MSQLPIPKPRSKPNPVVTTTEDDARERRWEGNVDIKVDVAACIKNVFGGVSLLIVAVAALVYPGQGLASSALRAVSSLLKLG